MPFPFALPTTSQLNFQVHLISSTHPSLPAAATSHRNVFRSALKAHKRLPEAQQSNNLQTILTTTDTYVPYLLALDSSLSGHPVSGEDIDITLAKEVEVEWRPTLSSSQLPGREPPRIKGRGLDYEIYSVLHCQASTRALLARHSLFQLHASSTPTPELRLSHVQSANKHLMAANAIHLYLSSRALHDGEPPSFPKANPDVSPTLHAALAELTLAEATLIYVLMSDPYPALLIQARNRDDREWMIKAPTIQPVRALLFSRLALAAAEHAGIASSSLRAEGARVSGELLKYCDDLRRTSRAKAARFAGIEADTSGKTGEGIAWLRGGLAELGVTQSQTESSSSSSSPSLSISKLKSSFREKKEDRKIAAGKADWGLDAGRSEEARILEYLERKWSKMNDTVNVQVVPDWRPLLAGLPSGREAMTPRVWDPVCLSADEVSRLRGPPDLSRLDLLQEEDDSDEVETPVDGSRTASIGNVRDPVGAFPGTRAEYGNGGSASRVGTASGSTYY